jgi:phage terminase small subunit
MTKSRGIGRGGYREGAGRTPSEPVKLDIPVPIADSLAHKDPKVFLFALMNDSEADIKVRADAAKALMPFIHQKVGEASTKDQKNAAAKVAEKGRFGAVEAPKLVVNNGR